MPIKGMPMNGEPRDILDVSTLPAQSGSGPVKKPPARQFLSLYFSCANAYGRAYRSRDGRCYEGRCQRCGKSIDFPIGEGGTSRRMFEVSCE